MSQHNVKKLHSIYRIVLAVLVVLLGAVLVLSCLDIYQSSDRDPYSPASVSQAFHRIQILVYIVLAGILGGIILELVVPQEQKRPKAIISQQAKVQTLLAKLSPEDAALAVRTYSKGQRVLSLLPWVVSAALMVYPAYYFADTGHFTVANLNADIVKAVLVVMLPGLLCLASFFLFQLLINRKLKKQAEFCKQLLAASGSKSNRPAPAPAKNGPIWGIRIGVAAIAVALILLGIFNGGAQDVLKKAVAICTECIGLG